MAESDESFDLRELIPDFSDLKTWVSLFATIATVMQFLSGLLVCNDYLKKHSTGEASPLTFIGTMLSCAFWLGYGILKPDDTIMFVNVIGVILNASYVFLFFTLTRKKMLVLKQLFVALIMLLMITVYANWQSDPDILLNQLGLMACSLTLVAIGAPLSKLMHVIKVKSTECLPYQIILMSFFGTSLWCTYGFMKNDVYLQVPNLIGASLALLQLSLFLLYPRKPRQVPMLPMKLISE